MAKGGKETSPNHVRNLKLIAERHVALMKLKWQYGSPKGIDWAFGAM